MQLNKMYDNTFRSLSSYLAKNELHTADCVPLETIHFPSKLFFYMANNLPVICVYRLKLDNLYI